MNIIAGFIGKRSNKLQKFSRKQHKGFKIGWFKGLIRKFKAQIIWGASTNK